MNVEVPVKNMNIVRRYSRLDRARRRLIVEAAVQLAMVSGAIALLPFRRAILLGSVPLGPVDAAADAGLCAWAVSAVARRVPWRAMCIEQGIAVQRLLRRRGFDARLHYGIANDREPGKLEAHVWVTLNGSDIMGGKEAAAFAPVAQYP